MVDFADKLEKAIASSLVFTLVIVCCLSCDREAGKEGKVVVTIGQVKVGCRCQDGLSNGSVLSR